MTPAPLSAATALLMALLVGACAVPDRSLPPDPDAMARLRVASVAEANGQPGVALSLYGAEAAREPLNSAAQSGYARALQRAGEIGQADEVLRYALAQAPEDLGLLNEAARVRLLRGDPTAAVTLFDRVLARAPNDAHALSGKGVGLDLQDLSAEALHWHAAAAKVASDDLMVMNNFAVSLLLAGKPNEAVPILTRLVDRPGAPSRVLNNLTLAAAAAGPAIPSGSVAPIRGDDRDVLLYALMLQAHPTPPASEIGR